MRSFEILRKEIHNLGFVYGLKSFANIKLQGKLGKRIYSIRNRKLGYSSFRLRTCTSDIDMANSIIGPDGGYDFLFNITDTVKDSRFVLDGGDCPKTKLI